MAPAQLRGRGQRLHEAGTTIPLHGHHPSGEEWVVWDRVVWDGVVWDGAQPCRSSGPRSREQNGCSSLGSSTLPGALWPRGSLIALEAIKAFLRNPSCLGSRGTAGRGGCARLPGRKSAAMAPRAQRTPGAQLWELSRCTLLVAELCSPRLSWWLPLASQTS